MISWKKSSFLLVLAGLLVYGVFKLDIHKMGYYVLHVDPWYLGLVFFFSVLSFVLWNVRWQFSLLPVGRIPFFRLLPVLMAGMFVNIVTPTAGLGGEPVRAYYIRNCTRAKIGEVLVLTVLEKLFGTAVTVVAVVFSLVYLTFFVPGDVVRGAFLLLLLALLVLLCLVIVVLWNARIRHWGVVDWGLKLLYKMKIFSLFSKNFSSFAAFKRFVFQEVDRCKLLLKKVFREKWFVYGNLALTVVITLVNYLIFYCAFLAIGYELDLVHTIIVFTLATVLGDISFIPGGAGVTEVLSVGLLSAFGMSLEMAATATLVYRAVYYVLTLGVGYLCLVYVQWND
ncbi:MAG: lysylphosphatidylglycerol synthase transmembrane domain-containing protein [Nanoarchaeota archaeon]|nr:lysylphosphatidylglycerol synthase transmembrane domain-containing protein [Nanoarchaeota archaeon]